MRKFVSAVSAAVLVTLLGTHALVGQTIDGTLDASYGSAVSVQTVNTGFGDDDGAANDGSEWNAAYGCLTETTLSLMFTGNLEDNFNKLEIFIDTGTGGSNVLTTAGNDGSGVMNGMTFDSGFAPSYHIIARRGNDVVDKFDLDFADLSAGTFDSYTDIAGGVNDGFSAMTGTGIVNANPISVGFDDSNILGISGGTGMADQTAALAVTTGLELGIDLADLGSPTGPIRVMLIQNNQNHDFLSNQTLGGLAAGTDNLGGNPGMIDFNNFAGDQFFTVNPKTIPEPAAMGIVAIGMIGLITRRRR